MGELATELGISKKTLYANFENKQELLREALLSQVDTVVAGIRSIVDRPADPPALRLSDLTYFLGEALPRFSKEFLDDLQRSAPELWKEMDSKRNTALRESLGKLVEEGQSLGSFRPDLDHEIFMLILLTLIQRLMNPEVLSKIPLTAPQLAANIIDTLSVGILSEAGRAHYTTLQQEGA